MMRAQTAWGSGRGRIYPARLGLALVALLMCAAWLSDVSPAASAHTAARWQLTGGPSGGAGSGPSGSSGSGSRSGRQSKTPGAGPLGGSGMWIWYVSQSNGGNLNSIIATARRHHVRTLMIKSGDGTGFWGQFSRHLVTTLHAAGLHVCGWQYVYGTQPNLEAQVGATAVQHGADCLLIDAESQYEGKYVQAQRYVRRLRQLIGHRFALGLASFPYVDYHPSFPYSVFLGPGGAQFNAPQMYWRDIGTTVNAVYSHTYSFNTPYARPMVPLGEVAGNPPPRQIIRFRRLAKAYRAPGLSWWDWQSASPRGWRAVGAPITPLTGPRPQYAMPILSRNGAGVLGRGDLVVWAQEHLLGAGYWIVVDGVFGSQTHSAVRSLQTRLGLRVTGRIDAVTWKALLRYPAAKVTWTSKGARASRGQSPAPAADARSLLQTVPLSARLPAVRYEIPAELGQG